MVKYNRRHVYLVAIFLFLKYNWCFKNKDVRSLITCLKTLAFIKTSFLWKEFEGIMPLEITVDTKRKRGNETLYLEKDGCFKKRLKKYLNFQNRSPFLI
jgi:hypothetical protein